MKTKSKMTFLDKKGYRALVKKAEEFVEVLTGDAAYERPGVNRVALESMLVGWLRSTPRWKQYSKFCTANHPRENLYLLAQGQATQAAEDAIFSGHDSVCTFFCTIQDLNAMIDNLPPRKKPAFAAKIGELQRFRQLFV